MTPSLWKGICKQQLVQSNLLQMDFLFTTCKGQCQSTIVFSKITSQLEFIM